MTKPKNATQQRYSIQEDKPSGWFEPLYASASPDGAGVPWANMQTHPSFANWLKHNKLNGSGKQALVVGCGMGDDAIELESLGFQVTAFDVSASAIQFCQQRFPASAVQFVQADLLDEHAQWQHRFDFVLEIFTIQALPPRYEQSLIRKIADFVAPGGQLLVIAEVAAGPRDFANGPPWVLTPDHVNTFESLGLGLTGKIVERGTLNDSGQTFITTYCRDPG